MTSIFDVAVIGVGGIGSAALYELTKRGLKVVGIDQFSPPHAAGSSHGHSRIIRTAYFEHPDYVPLLRHAFELWENLEKESREWILHRTGLLQAGREDGEVIPGVLASAQLHNLAVERLDERALSKEMPRFRIPADFVALYEKEAGVLFVERAIEQYLKLAQANGAELVLNRAIRGATYRNQQHELETDAGTIHAKFIVICAGSWTRKLLKNLRVPLTVVRKHLYWYWPKTSHFASDGMPAFLFETPSGCYYGMPAYPEFGLKMADHGNLMDCVDPDNVDRSGDHRDSQLVRGFRDSYFHETDWRDQMTASCLYTMSPDGHFIVDDVPDLPDACLVAGLSGHGYKFASVLGYELAERVVSGNFSARTRFLSLQRFST